MLRTTVSRRDCSLTRQRTMISKKGWTGNLMRALEQFRRTATLLNILCQFCNYFLHRSSCDRTRKLSIYVYIYSSLSWTTELTSKHDVSYTNLCVIKITYWLECSPIYIYIEFKGQRRYRRSFDWTQSQALMTQNLFHLNVRLTIK